MYVLLVLTLSGLDWVAVDGIATPGRRRALWSDDEFDVLLTHPWVPEAVKHPKYTHHPIAPHEALRLVREGAQDVGRELGMKDVQYRPDHELGDGTLGGMKALAAKDFHAVAPRGMMANIMYGLDMVGSRSRHVDVETAIGEYGMVAERASANPRVSQLMQLLLSQQYPDTTKIFGMIHDLLSSFDAPKESLGFIQEVRRMYLGGSPPRLDQLRQLQNMTWARLRNRTRGAAGQIPVSNFRSVDHWKYSQKKLEILFKLPCHNLSPVCFYLSLQTFARKRGPGIFDEQFQDPPGSLSHALSIAFQTPVSLVSVPFYSAPQAAAGTEFDIEFNGVQKDFFFNPLTLITADLGLADTEACSGYGHSAFGRHEMCAIPKVEVGGGTPSIHFKVGLKPTRSRNTDISMMSYNVLRFDGLLGESIARSLLSDSAYVGFYHVFSSPYRPVYPMSVESSFF